MVSKTIYFVILKLVYFKWTEKEIREMTSFTIVTNNITYLGVTLTKQMKDLYGKNFKSLKKDTEEHLRRWKDLQCSWIGRINIVKITTLLKAIYKFNAVPSKLSNQFFIELERVVCKFIWNNKNSGYQKLVSTIKEHLRESPSLTSSCITEQ